MLKPSCIIVQTPINSFSYYLIIFQRYILLSTEGTSLQSSDNWVGRTSDDVPKALKMWHASGIKVYSPSTLIMSCLLNKQSDNVKERIKYTVDLS